MNTFSYVTKGRFLRMNAGSFLTLAVLLAVNQNSLALDWTSPDGFLSVTPPPQEQFDQLPTPPHPFIVLWVSHDESMKFGVMKALIPRSMNLVQSSVEEGLAEEIGSIVTRLPTKQLSGHEVWTMAASGASVDLTQSLVRHDASVYKVMTLVSGSQDQKTLAEDFLDSLSVAQQISTQPTESPHRQPPQELGERPDAHNLSETIGVFCTLLTMALLVYFAVWRKNAE